MVRFVPFLVIVLLGILLAVGLGRSSTKSDIPSPLIGKSIPEFTLPLLTDESVQLDREQLLGQPFLLNVWASWCVTCRYEHPVIEELSASGKLRVVGLNYRDAREDALRWLDQFGNPYDVIIADRDGRVSIDFGVYAAPESFLVDANGTILFKQIGALTPEIIEAEILPRLAQGNQPGGEQPGGKQP